jgi:hypothetical protein
MASWQETLRDGLREQHEIYSELELHTRRQGEILIGGKTDQILALAQAKESTLARIESIDSRKAPLKERWRGERDDIPQASRDEIQAELDRLHLTLRGLIALESEQQQRVDAARGETADQLRRIEGGRRVNQAYGTASTTAPAPKYLDRTE